MFQTNKLMVYEIYLQFYFELNKSRLESLKLLLKLLLSREFLSLDFKFIYFLKGLKIILKGSN